MVDEIRAEMLVKTNGSSKTKSSVNMTSTYLMPGLFKAIKSEGWIRGKYLLLTKANAIWPILALIDSIQWKKNKNIYSIYIIYIQS